jgi:hypothetical protein
VGVVEASVMQGTTVPMATSIVKMPLIGNRFLHVTNGKRASFSLQETLELILTNTRIFLLTQLETIVQCISIR